MMESLKKMNDRGAFVVNWRTFSHSNNVLQIPKDQLLIESNLHSRPEGGPLGFDNHIKSIVKVDRVKLCGHAHFCEYQRGWYARNEKGRVVKGPYNEYPSEDQILMHHYHKRSLQDFLMKRFRGRASVANHHFTVSAIEKDLDDTNSLTFASLDTISPAFAPVRYILGLDA